ncbi:xanthine dehydrogenase small subunit [Halocynthiibacter namhaensis]|uniref:xanthine dehydrogenase small subunit n=1 Tax=Halocynthiibacter namhaensis TaxID=1290553 RepID=UPI0005797F9A|nr:xanthine dehydrogenase small subunit [Halocynthiibacter namhaensis]
MSQVEFLLNGEAISLTKVNPTETLLDFLRNRRGLSGTKEGCNEGDCGACTVMIEDPDGTRALNSCILLLPQLAGKSITTVEGLAAPNGTLHPVQDAMIEYHGSQCGFCTPGFVMSMATAHKNGATDYDDQLAGNLCRCTGYAPIIRAAKAAEDQPVPAHIKKPFILPEILAGDPGGSQPPGATTHFRPHTSDEFAAWYAANPDATLIAGATDVGLWVTKQLRDLPNVAFLNGIKDLQSIDIADNEIRIGAGVTIENLRPVMNEHFPSFGEMLRRFSSTQVRNAATIGGNIANGSPIGDSPPALIALNARLHLRKGDARRDIALEDFFITYGKQDRAPGEFVEAITIPKQPDCLRVYKLSKRFDQDISAVLGAIYIYGDGKTMTDVRIAFGGMAGTPQRATHVENALRGKPWTAETIEAACAEFSKDYTPMTDMRASADYRLEAAQNMLRRYMRDAMGQTVSVLEVTP